jgi:hypothetical protein
MFSVPRRYFADMLFLLGSERRKLPWLLAGFLLVALMDVFGLATVGSYIVYLTQSEESAPPILAVLTLFYTVDVSRYVMPCNVPSAASGY